ncbi:hypothetical protein D3C83_95440 [compost metagenome]
MRSRNRSPRMTRPRCHVVISVKIPVATVSVNHPPPGILGTLAAAYARSGMMRKRVTAAANAGVQPKCVRATKNASVVVMTIVSVIAMP